MTGAPNWSDLIFIAVVFWGGVLAGFWLADWTHKMRSAHVAQLQAQIDALNKKVAVLESKQTP